MDIIEIANKIEEKIAEIEKIKGVIKNRGIKKARAIAEYRKQYALKIIQLKNGTEFEFEGEKIKNPLATITKEIAHGLCWREKLESEQADALYKAAIAYLDATEAQLNAYQSLNRYLKYDT